MGTPSTTKYLKNSAGVLAEEPAILTSVGIADAQKIPALNPTGVLDPTLVNGTTSSAGGSDAGKFPQLDASGKLDTTVMPVGIGAVTALITTSESLSAGDFVTIYDNFGARIQRASATIAGKHAMGFVLMPYVSDVLALVYLEGRNSAVSGQTPGDVFLSTTPGHATSTPPTSSGNIVQSIGFATSATSINFLASRPITLA
jgi:hypothetical protein